MLYTNTLTYNICVVYWNLNRPYSPSACRWFIKHPVPLLSTSKACKIGESQSLELCYRISCLPENIKQAGDANAGNDTRVEKQRTAKLAFDDAAILSY